MKKTLLLFVAFATISLSAQDTCATAMTVTSGTYTVAAINGTEIPDPICATNGAGANFGEWYTFTATVTGAGVIDTNLAVNIAPFSDDTRIHVYEGSCGALTCVGGNDDVDGTNYLSYAVFPITAGTTYYFAFDDRWSDLGFDFVLSEDPSIGCDTTFPVNEDWTSVFGLNCWSVEDANVDALTWGINNTNDFNGDGADDSIVNIFPAAASGGPAKDDWLFSQAVSFDATHSYDVTVKYNSITLNFTANESMDILMVDSPSSSATGVVLLESVTGIVPLGTFGDATGNDPLTLAYTSTNTFIPTATGNYNLALHATSAAGGDVFFVTEVEIIDNGVTASTDDNILASSVKMYPTATSESFTINNQSNIALTSVSLYDVNGRIVLTNSLDNLIGEKSINVANLSSGLYFVEINSADAKLVKKLIIK